MRDYLCIKVHINQWRAEGGKTERWYVNYNSILGFILMDQCANHWAKYKIIGKAAPEEGDERHFEAKNINNVM